MFKGAWAIKQPGKFKRIPATYSAFASYKKREAYMIGVGALMFGTAGACLVALLRQIPLSNALLACARWQGVSTAVALGALLFA